MGTLKILPPRESVGGGVQIGAGTGERKILPHAPRGGGARVFEGGGGRAVGACRRAAGSGTRA
jgi:hypothetical protein